VRFTSTSQFCTVPTNVGFFGQNSSWHATEHEVKGRKSKKQQQTNKWTTN
jgi:hypothetical protein